MPGQRVPRWVVPGASEFLWEQWGEECVLFDPRTGQTHALNPLAAEALVSLQRRALTATQLTAHLAELIDLRSKRRLAQQVEDILHEFEELGLVERCSR